LEGHKTQTRLVNIGPVTSIGPKKSSPGDYQVDLDLNVPNPKPVQVSPVGMRRGVLIVPPNTYPVKKKLKPGKEINRVVTTRLRQILRNADLGKITMKNIQTQLEVDLEISLSDRKDFIREEVRFLTGLTKSWSAIFCRRTAPDASQPPHVVSIHRTDAFVIVMAI
jgi:hypothetical protein